MNVSQRILEHMCRACMCKNQNFHSLCDKAADWPLTFHEMFATSIPQVAIDRNDELSKKICATCLSTLITVHKFQQMCSASDACMRSLLVSNSFASSKTNQQEDAKHIVVVHGTTKTDSPNIIQDTYKSPSTTIKVEIDENSIENLILLEPVEKLCDIGSNAIPQGNTENNKHNPLIKEEPQNCIKLEITDVEMQESDLMNAISIGEDKNEGDKDAHIDNDTAIELNAQNSDHAKSNKASDTEWSAAEDDDTTSEWSVADYKSNSKNRQKNKFCCVNCDAMFVDKQKYKKHARLHDKTRKFSCEICNYRFTSRKILTKHKHTHNKSSPNGEFKCPNCQKRFEKRSSLTMHMKTHTKNNEKDNTCLNSSNCDGTSKHNISKATIEHSTIINNSSTNDMSMNNSEQIFKENLSDGDDATKVTPTQSVDNVKSQENPTLEEQQDTKSEHQEETTSKENEQDQQQPSTSHNTEKTERLRRKTNFRCNECNKSFTSESKLQSHLQLYHETANKTLALENDSNETTSTKGYKCPNCPRRFEKHGSLSLHLRNYSKTKPLENKKHACTICEKKFKQSAQLEKHIRKKHGLKPFICEFCKKELSSESALKTHRRQHTGEKPFHCSQCGKSFQTNKYLTDHLLRHSGIKSYQCSECPSKFACDVDRRKHLLIHSGVKYACDLCDQKFTRHDSINKHKRAVHSDERPYKCDQCDMTFAILQHMRRHQRTHTGEKPYKCKYCEKAYADSGDFKRHLRRHVGENTYMCEECPEKFKYFKELKEHNQFHFKQKQQNADNKEV